VLYAGRLIKLNINVKFEFYLNIPYKPQEDISFMNKTVFEYSDYKRYLVDFLKSKPGNGHGIKTQIAKAANCHIAYISQILNKDAHFSLEQAEEVNKFLGHSKDEGLFFLLLIQHSRAGTTGLRARFKEQMNTMLEKRLVLKDRVDIKKTLSDLDQIKYYSSWHYAATHMAVSILKLQTRESLAEHFNLPIERINEILEFLLSINLVVREGSKFKVGVGRIFLGNDSNMISKHHTNWRIRAIESLDHNLKSDLHFSTVVTLSSDDVKKIKEQLVKYIEDIRGIVRESAKDEELYSFCLDFFEL
jgi:uncharacterized protein (TIGR02147 family)